MNYYGMIVEKEQSQFYAVYYKSVRHLFLLLMTNLYCHHRILYIFIHYLIAYNFIYL